MSMSGITSTNLTTLQHLGMSKVASPTTPQSTQAPSAHAQSTQTKKDADGDNEGSTSINEGDGLDVIG